MRVNFNYMVRTGYEGDFLFVVQLKQKQSSGFGGPAFFQLIKDF